MSTRETGGRKRQRGGDGGDGGGEETEGRGDVCEIAGWNWRDGNCKPTYFS